MEDTQGLVAGLGAEAGDGAEEAEGGP